MESLVEEYYLLLQIPGCEVYDIQNGNPQLIQKGTLDVIEFKAKNLFVIQVNTFKYSLAKELPILSCKEPDGTINYVLPNVNGHFGIKLLEKIEPQIMEVFDIIINQHASLFYQEIEQETPGSGLESAKGVGMTGQNGTISNSNANGFVFEKNLSAMPPQNVIQGTDNKSSLKSKFTTEKISSALTSGGQYVKSGMIKVAEKLSSGIKSGGQYIQKRYIKKREEKPVNPETLAKLKIAKSATSVALTYTRAQVQGLIEIASSIAQELGKNFENSETGQKWQQSPNYEKAKVIGMSTVNATAAVFDGMVEAMMILGRGVSSATTDIVTVKYGEKMGEATKDGFDCVGNVGLMARAYTVEGVKAIEDKTANKNVNNQDQNGYPNMNGNNHLKYN